MDEDKHRAWFGGMTLGESEIADCLKADVFICKILDVDHVCGKRRQSSYYHSSESTVFDSTADSGFCTFRSYRKEERIRVIR